MMKAVYRISIAVFASAIFANGANICSSSSPQCTYGDPFILVNNNAPITWQAAEDYCVSEHTTHLAKIYSEEMQFTAAALCGQTNGRQKCWIGLKKDETEDEWVWPDGKSLDDTGYESWATNEPSDCCGETVAMLNPEKNMDWGDFDPSGDYRTTRFKSGVIVQSFLCDNPDYDPDRVCLCNCDECILNGDPHIDTFDNTRYHYMGECSYLLVSPCAHSGADYSDLPFEISASLVECYTDGASCIEDITVTFYSVTGAVEAEILMQSQRQASFTDRTTVSNLGTNAVTVGEVLDLDEERKYKWSQGEFFVDKTSSSGDLELVIFVKYADTYELIDARIRLSGSYAADPATAWVFIYLSECYHDFSCGLCGLFNGIDTDDLTKPDGTELSTEGVDKISNTAAYERSWEFGNSWLNYNLTENIPDCVDPDIVILDPDCLENALEFCEQAWAECQCTEYTEANNDAALVEVLKDSWTEGCTIDLCAKNDIPDDCNTACQEGLLQDALSMCPTDCCDYIDCGYATTTTTIPPATTPECIDPVKAEDLTDCISECLVAFNS